MIKEIIKFEWLGTPDWFVLILKDIYDNGGISTDALQRILSRPYKQYPYIDGAGHLMLEMGLIKKTFIFNKLILNTDNKVIKCFLLYLRSETDKNTFINQFANQVFECLISDADFKIIFNEKILKRDLHNNIIIDRDMLGPKYSQILNLFLDFGIIYQDDGFKVEDEFRKILINCLQKRKFSDLQIDDGVESEQFVLRFEEQRIGSDKSIEHVSLTDDTAGYDIASFEENFDQRFNRFIEVKSYIGRPSFYWTKNEKQVAECLKGKYYIYLVDRSRISDSNYTPIIIKNPSILSLQNDYTCEATQYFFRKI